MTYRIINLFAGPGAGKSTTAAALFAELKYRGVNTELVTEYAKDGAWEKRGEKFFKAQEYIFGKQHFRIGRVIDDVDVVVTDSPLLLGLVYMPRDFYLPKLRDVIIEAHQRYESINVYLDRNKPYSPVGRNQTEDEAKELDNKILGVLDELNVDYTRMPVGRWNSLEITRMMINRGWITETCPYCTDESLGTVFYDQTCSGCCERMTR